MIFHKIILNLIFIWLFGTSDPSLPLNFFVWYKSHMFFSFVRDNYEFIHSQKSMDPSLDIEFKKAFQKNEEAWRGHKEWRPTTRPEFKLNGEKSRNKKRGKFKLIWYKIKLSEILIQHTYHRTMKIGRDEERSGDRGFGGWMMKLRNKTK